MQLLPSLDEVAWVDGALSPANLRQGDGGWDGAQVSHFVPAIYPAYAKLFHPIYEDLSVVNRNLSWDRLEKAEQPRSLSPLEHIIRQATMVYGSPDVSAPLRPLTWRQLADRYGLHYTPTLHPMSLSRLFSDGSWPRHLVGPQEGYLEEEARTSLAELLMRETRGDCYFYFWILATTDWKDSLLYRGSLDDVAKIPQMTDRVRLTPTYWFPPDRSWFVSTDYDSPFTLIGGSDQLIERLLASETLECMRVSPKMRMDAAGDKPNIRTN